MSIIEKDHWENIFSTKAETEFSWFQSYPKTSVDFLELFDLPLDANIIDIGGGDSHLVDVLIERRYQNIYVLDISENALNRTKQRVGKNAGSFRMSLISYHLFNLIFGMIELPSIF